MFFSKIKQNLTVPLVFILFYLITLFFLLPYILPKNILGNHEYLITTNKTDEQVSPLFLLLFLPFLFRYLLNIFLSPFYEINSKINSKTVKTKIKDYRPLVSILIPAWNEEVGIINTIKSIKDNQYKAKEIIIINDGSTDNTEKKVKNFIHKYKGNTKIIYLNKQNGGKASALNLGLVKAQGEIIITIDADSHMKKDTIYQFVEKFKNPEIMSVAGNVKIGNTKNILGIVQMIEYLSGFYFKKADSLLNSIYIVGGAAAAYRKEVFNELGGFDENTITEDIEYSTRLQSKGYKIAYSSKAIIYTEGPAKFKDIVKQRLRWKWGRFETFLKYRSLFFNPRKNKILTMFVLPLAVFAEILLFFEIFLLTFLYTQIIITGNYFMLLISIFIVSMIFCLQIATDESGKNRVVLVVWAPVVWLFFYIIDFIEYCAQLKCLINSIRRKQVRWQKWQRAGVFGEK